MALHFSGEIVSEWSCDRCKDSASEQRPLLRIWTTGRHYDERNFLQIHLDCLAKIVKKVEAEIVGSKQPQLAEAKRSA